MCLFTGFVKTISDKQTAVNVRIDDTQKTEEARNNREAIKAIADTVIFLGREGLPFRGHEDDTKHHAVVGEQSSNGLFTNLLNFQVSRGDNVLKKPQKMQDTHLQLQYRIS